jgi:GT2 family glycosyltransferase
VDADVRVRADTFSKLLATFAGSALVCAVSASSDGTSADGGVPTQYWNLLKQFGARAHDGPGIHFEAACGAVRRDAFVHARMFNEWRYRGASVEDLDLGLRLHRNGQQVLLQRDVAVSHLRAHSLRGVLGAIWRRSSLLTRTLGYSATRTLARTEVVHTLNSAVGFAAIGVATLIVLTLLDPREPMIILSAIAMALLLAANFGIYRFFARRRGLTFAIAAVPLHVAAQVVATAGRGSGWILRNVVGDPSPDATTQAFAEVGVQIWPPVPRKP